MLFTTTIPRLALDRFHLQTGSFVGWSLQQIIPPMYNFENEFEFVADRPVSAAVLEYAKFDHQMNHFPVRCVTFFEGRYRLFNEGNGANLKLVSRYRQQRLITNWRVIASDTGLELKLVNKQLDQNFAP